MAFLAAVKKDPALQRRADPAATPDRPGRQQAAQVDILVADGRGWVSASAGTISVQALSED